MKNPHFLSRTIMLMIFCGSCLVSFSQSSADPHLSKPSVFHHWHNLNPDLKLSSATENEYKNLPQTDYTPIQNIASWSAADKIKSFASGLTGKLSVLYILSVDETGYIRKVKTVKTNDTKNAAALTAMLLNTKVSGPSYIENQAVASYMPCSISIDKNQITIQ